MEKQFVVFKLANEYYGIDIAFVESIITLPVITGVAGMPAFIEGVMNLRGAVLPVMDLRQHFGLPKADPTRETRIAVVQIEGHTVGMVVDAVVEVLSIPVEVIEPLSTLINITDAACITGIAKLAQRLVILLDLAQLLTPTEKVDLRTLHSPQPVSAPRG